MRDWVRVGERVGGYVALGDCEGVFGVRYAMVECYGLRDCDDDEVNRVNRILVRYLLVWLGFTVES